MRKEQILKSNSAAETKNIAKELAENASPGDVIALSGDLGVGKTVFAQGFAEGLGISEAVTSPTFIIMQQYEGGRLMLYHLDVYRIEEAEELEEIGIDECLYGEGVCLVEWAERVGDILPAGTIFVKLEKLPFEGDELRKITIVKETCA